ncbi:MAG: tetratricopeptide repeat protein [Planctomycetota bacterium]|nr:tetratricopeptide repeat protein [Planctomycetota bacterium]
MMSTQPTAEFAPSTSESNATAAAVLLLVAVTLAVYAPSVFQNGFLNWDDQGQLFKNPDFNPPTFHSVSGYWFTPHMSLYMPVTYTLWGITAAIAQTSPDSAGITLNPAYFHALNLVLHIAVTLMVFAILRRFEFRIFASCAAAMVFAIHPIQVEAVCWASGMYTVLSGVFVLAAVFLYSSFSRSVADRAHSISAPSKRRSVILYSTATCVFVLAMLSKPSAVVAILLAAILDLLVARRSLSATVKALAPWAVLAAPLIYLLRQVQPASIVADQPLWFRPVIMANAISSYLVKLVFPLNLAVDYGDSPMWLRAHPAALLMIVLPVAVGCIALTARRRAPWFPVGLALLASGALPFLGLMKFDFQHFSTVADRYIYPGMLGVSWIIAGVLDTWNKIATRVVAAALLLLLASLSFVQTQVWRDTGTLFAHNLEVNPTSLQANSNLGFLAMADGKVDEAIAHYRNALIADPQDPDTNADLGNALMATGALDEAIEHYRVALRLMPNDPRIINNLGIALARSGHLREAATEFATAIRLDEGNTDPARDVRAGAHINLGLIHQQAGNLPAAADEFRQALVVDPHSRSAAIALQRLNAHLSTKPAN